MTLDEAIKHAEEVAEENEKFCYKKGGKGGYFNEDTDWDNAKCAAEHRQLAEWLKELQAHREAWTVVVNAMKECSYKIWHEFGEYVGEDREQIKIINLKTALDILEDYRPKEGDAE